MDNFSKSLIEASVERLDKTAEAAGLSEAPNKVTVQFYDDQAEGRDVYDMTPTVTKLYPEKTVNELLEKVVAEVQSNAKLKRSAHLIIDFSGYHVSMPAKSDISKKLTSIIGKPVIASLDGEIDPEDLESF